MKVRTMMMAAGIGVLGWATGARAQAPDTSPPAAPMAPLPSTIPDVDEPTSPTAPAQPGVVPPMATPETLPPPAPPASPPLQPAPGFQPQPVYEGEGTYHGYPAWMTKVGSAMMLGGGYQDFTQSAPKSVTNVGGMWNARLAAGTRQFIGLEAAYVGGVRSTRLLGGTTNTNLINNGVEGDLRLNVPVPIGIAMIEPFGFVGLGWQHYNFSKTVATADVTSSDDIMTLPYGAGLMATYGMFMLDARVTWVETYFNNMFAAEGAKLNTFGVGGNIGVEF